MELELTKQVFSPDNLDDKGNAKAMTFRQLKDFLNTLQDETLDSPVKYWGEEFAGSIYSIDQFEDDAIDMSGDGVEPKRSYTEREYYLGDPADFEDSKERAETEPIVYKKGQIILSAY